MVGVPEMTPAVDRLRPGGREPAVTDQPVDEMEAVDEDVVAESVRDSDEPEVLVWVPGLVTVTMLLTFQLNVADPVAPRLSVAVRVTE